MIREDLKIYSTESGDVLAKEIAGFSGRYILTLSGDVFSNFRGYWKQLKVSNNGSGYLQISLKNESSSTAVNCKIARLLYETFVEPLAPGEMIDHANKDIKDNSLGNLRKCDKRQNAYNSTPSKRTNAHSRYKGVSYDPTRRGAKKWTTRARLLKDGLYKMCHVGHYQKQEEAALAYNIRASAQQGDFARLNNCFDSGLLESFVNTEELRGCNFNLKNI